MTIIGLNGSPRLNGNTAAMLDAALEGAASRGTHTRRVNLFDLDYSGCVSCFSCKRLGGKSFTRCALQDDLSPLLNDILCADGLVLACPVYFSDVPGCVRSLLERLCFPGFLYARDGRIAYTRRIPVGLILTMNNPDPATYQNLITQLEGLMSYMLGPVQTVTASDTLQYDDYSLYASEKFDFRAKLQRHQAVFPQECRRARDMGASLISPC